MTREEIEQWCEDNLFGNRKVPGVEGKIPLNHTQGVMKRIAAEIIEKWEARSKSTT